MTRAPCPTPTPSPATSLPTPTRRPRSARRPAARAVHRQQLHQRQRHAGHAGRAGRRRAQAGALRRRAARYTVDGQTLEGHAGDSTALARIAEGWDFVVLQDQSGQPMISGMA
ncbi:MAG: hypothetical protein U1F43_37665 [Myxococcota bacterium]